MPRLRAGPPHGGGPPGCCGRGRRSGAGLKEVGGRLKRRACMHKRTWSHRRHPHVAERSGRCVPAVRWLLPHSLGWSGEAARLIPGTHRRCIVCNDHCQSFHALHVSQASYLAVQPGACLHLSRSCMPRHSSTAAVCGAGFTAKLLHLNMYSFQCLRDKNCRARARFSIPAGRPARPGATGPLPLWGWV